jgi:hypothetical protein
MRASIGLALLVLMALMLRPQDAAQLVSQEPPLPTIASAPEFTLTTQDGAQSRLPIYAARWWP